MNGDRQEAEALLKAIAGAEPGKADLVVCPPFTALAQAQDLLRDTVAQWGPRMCIRSRPAPIPEKFLHRCSNLWDAAGASAAIRNGDSSSVKRMN